MSTARTLTGGEAEETELEEIGGRRTPGHNHTDRHKSYANTSIIGKYVNIPRGAFPTLAPVSEHTPRTGHSRLLRTHVTARRLLS